MYDFQTVLQVVNNMVWRRSNSITHVFTVFIITISWINEL